MSEHGAEEVLKTPPVSNHGSPRQNQTPQPSEHEDHDEVAISRPQSSLAMVYYCSTN